MRRLIWAALVGVLFFAPTSYAKKKKARHRCFDHVLRAGIQSLSGHNAQIGQQPRLAELLGDIKRHNPHIDDYTEHFYSSNGHWPSSIQIMRHLKRGHHKVDAAIKEMMDIVDPQAYQLLRNLREQILKKIEALNGAIVESNEQIYRLGDLDVKIPLRKLKIAIYGDLGELETWLHIPRPVHLNFDFSHNTHHSHRVLQDFERRRRQLLAELKKAEPKQIMAMARKKGSYVFYEKKGAEQIKQRMVELLSTKEIDVVAQSGSGRLIFIEVKNYNVPIEDIESTQYAKKSILTQLAEVRWVVEALGMRDQIELGFIAAKGGIHPREARKLLSHGIRVYKLPE